MGSSLGLEQASGPCLWVRREFARIPRLQNSVPFFYLLSFACGLSLFPALTLFPFLSPSGFIIYGSHVVFSLILLGLLVLLLPFLSIVIFRLQYLINLLKVTHPTLHCLAFVSCIAITISHCFSFMFCFITYVLHSIPVSVLSSALHSSPLFFIICSPSFAVASYYTP